MPTLSKTHTDQFESQPFQKSWLHNWLSWNWPWAVKEWLERFRSKCLSKLLVHLNKKSLSKLGTKKHKHSSIIITKVCQLNFFIRSSFARNRLQSFKLFIHCNVFLRTFSTVIFIKFKCIFCFLRFWYWFIQTCFMLNQHTYFHKSWSNITLTLPWDRWNCGVFGRIVKQIKKMIGNVIEIQAIKLYSSVAPIICTILNYFEINFVKKIVSPNT